MSKNCCVYFSHPLAASLEALRLADIVVKAQMKNSSEPL